MPDQPALLPPLATRHVLLLSLHLLSARAQAIDASRESGPRCRCDFSAFDYLLPVTRTPLMTYIHIYISTRVHYFYHRVLIGHFSVLPASVFFTLPNFDPSILLLVVLGISSISVSLFPNSKDLPPSACTALSRLWSSGLVVFPISFCLGHQRLYGDLLQVSAALPAWLDTRQVVQCHVCFGLLTECLSGFCKP
ncbi:hypothetical protein AUEXF2481DRAFT_503949 [Aureobasidium subglaciale EXF-2481]|uniref:Uncharacterized protein n=1 Tax=Aureobasidium subglaciale (strain EXF-2481) TaxID=1043005 RepID=A0A074YB69_AURSE|nr:uncharacterized protein AUEXF2481DRAFT_503949 [Aureobasidium subglaciale EXF-2481]KEQ91407.1 hypothetical protein AUEXF2481DRAFT_503949 [Aureobasidium subglaciale EXF-2481]